MDDDDGMPGLEDAPTDWEAWMQNGKKREPSQLLDGNPPMPVLPTSFNAPAPSEWSTYMHSTLNSQQKEPTQVYNSSPEMANYLPSLSNQNLKKGTPCEAWSTGIPATFNGMSSGTSFNGSSPWAIPQLSNAQKCDNVSSEGTNPLTRCMPPMPTVGPDNMVLSKPRKGGQRRPREPKTSSNGNSRCVPYGYSAITATHQNTLTSQMMIGGPSTVNIQQFCKVLTGKEEALPPPETLSVLKVVPFAADGNQFSVNKIDKKSPPFWETINVDVAVFYTMEVMRNPDSTVDELIFGECPAIKLNKNVAEEEELHMRIYFDILIMFIKRHEHETNTRVQLKVSHLTWNLNVCTDHILKIMTYLDPNYLRTLHLTGKKISTQALQLMIGSPYWQRLTEIKINGPTRLTLRSFYHCNTVNIQIKELHPVELTNFIKNYHAKNLLYAPNTRQPYFFIIRSARLKSEAFIQQVFNYFDQQKIAEQYETDATFMYKMNVFKFLSPHNETEEMCKVVYSHAGKINGYSCPKIGVTESFMHFDSDILQTFFDVDES
ncbi:hypothetical protein GCK72_021882 [Caenorhabditis remanei]|uniref:DUF38 domain-containing protein n=1 Tax=Caenorhabditis remanei TaxID=31234 RepID=A0A6A5GKZ0_CAERE|nr:hypothetical protein GCK72_021882 [Caenorhabditis remanei]KAF1755313.1 hypothetical protein GCK72_021882 [Caenorhabditis remanei]